MAQKSRPSEFKTHLRNKRYHIETSMLSSKMRTARLLPVSPSMHCSGGGGSSWFLPGGSSWFLPGWVCLPGGGGVFLVSSLGGGGGRCLTHCPLRAVIIVVVEVIVSVLWHRIECGLRHNITFKGNDCLSAFEHKSEPLYSIILFVLKKCLEKCLRKRLRKCLEKCLNLEQKS